MSTFEGPQPLVRLAPTEEAEIALVAGWLTDLVAKGVRPQELGIFVRSEAVLRRARAVARKAGLPAHEMTDKAEQPQGAVLIGVMHLAKGLEFRAVAVMACDDEVIPSQARIETVSDEGDLKEVYESERHLLYVACTRARDHLLVSAVGPGSEFLADLDVG